MVLAGCGLVPERVSRDDPRLRPMFEAMSRVDRAAMGFTDVPGDAAIRLEQHHSDGYDAMLHIVGRTSRTVAFRRTASGYEWVGEQETFRGPARYQTVDGEFNEEILLNFNKVPIAGFPVNALFVEYRGPNQALAWPNHLSLDQARPILARWGY